MATKIELNIEGMTCDHCVNAVKGALEGVPGVESATVSLDEKHAVVNGAIDDPKPLIAAIEEEGYEATVSA